MSNNHPSRHKWLKGLGGTEFLQFADGRITREQFPLGGYMYTASRMNTKAGFEHQTVYSGNDYNKAWDAVTAKAAT